MSKPLTKLAKPIEKIDFRVDDDWASSPRPKYLKKNTGQTGLRLISQLSGSYLFSSKLSILSLLFLTL